MPQASAPKESAVSAPLVQETQVQAPHVPAVCQSTAFPVGTKVQAKLYKVDGSLTSKFYPGVVKSMSEDGKYEIAFEDGTHGKLLPFEAIADR